MISVQPPSGFRDFLNNDAFRRLQLTRLIADVYQSFGFSPLETPILENLNILMGSGGQENEKLIFKVLKRGAKFQEAAAAQTAGAWDENEMAEYGLRFDLTLPLSRAVAAHRGEIHFPWKVFHIGPVWRADRPQKGRFREFFQCDVDIVGAKGVSAEIEVLQASVTALKKVGVEGFGLRLNDRRLLSAVGERFGFTGEKLAQFAIILDKKDKLETQEVLSQLAELLGFNAAADLPGPIKSIVEGNLKLEDAQEYHPAAVADLQLIMRTLQELKISLTGITFDPSLVRGMGYYTGPIFELHHPSAGYSFGGGGRYDQLIGRFSGQSVPACGFSIGFERLALLLAESQFQLRSNMVFIPVFSEELRSKTLQLAQQLREQGIGVDVFPDQAKIKNQFKFASDSGYRWILICGEEEFARGSFKLKDFKTSEEIELPQQNWIDYIVKSLSTKG